MNVKVILFFMCFLEAICWATGEELYCWEEYKNRVNATCKMVDKVMVSEP